MRNRANRIRGWCLTMGPVASLLAVVVMVLLTSGLTGAAADPPAAMGVILAERGKEAPDFTLADLEGKPMGLRGFRGKVVLLTFFTTW